MTGPVRADIARHLIGYGLRLVPLHPVDDAGRCTCAPGGCRSPAKHPKWTRDNSTASADWWEANPADAIGIDRKASRIVTVEDDGAGLTEWAMSSTSSGGTADPLSNHDYIPLPSETFTMASPAGNDRRFYRLPEGFTALGNHVKPDGWAVDILTLGRAPGPGTRRADGEYAIAHDRPVADAHPRLVAWLEARYEAREAARAGVVPGEEPDEIPEPVLELLGTDGSTDRSGMSYAITAACFEAGLSQANAVWLAEDHPEVCAKFEGRKEGVAGDVARIWAGWNR